MSNLFYNQTNVIIGKLIISEKLKKQIDYMHIKNPGTEWSGVLYYKLKKKSIPIEIIAIGMIPMNIGSVTFTTYENDSKTLNGFKHYKDARYFGMIHSHHNMAAKPSSQDLEEMVENNKYISPYLFVIVNNKSEYYASLVINTTMKSKLNHRIFKKNVNEDKIIRMSSLFDLDIVNGKDNIDEFFVNYLSEINKPKKSNKQKLIQNEYTYPGKYYNKSLFENAMEEGEFLYP